MLRIAALQATGTPDAVEENLSRLAAHARAAADAGARLLVTPELFTAGYAPARVHGGDGAGQRARLAEIARSAGLALVASTVDDDGRHRHISASFFDSSGRELTRYRKAHLFGPEERSVFSPGGAVPEVIDYLGVRIALGICYDIEFPGFAAAAVRRGAELLCIPTAVPATGDIGGARPELTYNAERISTLMVPVRALESGTYIVYANHAAPAFTGLSCIASPYGTVLAAAGRSSEELLLADVDPAEAARARSINTYAEDALPGLYA